MFSFIGLFSSLKDNVTLWLALGVLAIMMWFYVSLDIAESKLHKAEVYIQEQERLAKEQEANMTMLMKDANKTITKIKTVYKDREVIIVEGGKKDENQTCEQTLADIANYKSSI
jgi:hypothetical protein